MLVLQAERYLHWRTLQMQLFPRLLDHLSCTVTPHQQLAMTSTSYRDLAHKFYYRPPCHGPYWQGNSGKRAQLFMVKWHLACNLIDWKARHDIISRMQSSGKKQTWVFCTISYHHAHSTKAHNNDFGPLHAQDMLPHTARNNQSSAHNTTTHSSHVAASLTAD